MVERVITEITIIVLFSDRDELGHILATNTAENKEILRELAGTILFRG